MKRSKPRRLSLVGLFCAAAPLYASVARAEEASAAETAAARSLAVEGLKLAQAGNCTDALPKLERAEKLYHSAVVASRMGECLVSVGRLVEGTEVLRKVLREPQSGETAPALAKALERAQKVLDSAKPRIAGLTLKVTAVDDMTVKVDGSVVATALVDTEMPIDPGEHSVEISAPGFVKSLTRVSLGEGEKKNVSLTLARDPHAPVLAPVTPRPSSLERDTNKPASPSMASERSEPSEHAAPAEPAVNRAPAYIAMSVGAAAVATGAVLGVLTLKAQKDLKTDCPGGVCPTEREGDLTAAKRLGNVSTIAFGVGGAGLVLGAVLYFTAGSSNAEPVGSAPRPRFAGFSRPRLGIGLGSVELGADF